MKRYVVTLLLIMLSLPMLVAQELNCRVVVNSDKIQGTNKEVFNTLQTAISEYMNDTKFSSVQLSTVERIECTLQFIVSEYTDERMVCQLQVQSRRPVYNSSYTSTLINFQDNEVEFNYKEYDPLVFSTSTYENNLTCILNFYAYLILGIDFDSFILYVGDQFFEMARTMVQLGQSTQEPGWKAFENNRNRSAILSAFVEPTTKPFREMWYNYHRKGMDEMVLGASKARSTIGKSLATLTTLYSATPSSVLFPMFKEAKFDEIISIYSKASTNEKSDMYDLLINIYPSDNRILEKIKEESR
ncbi:MAG: DUF4835 family protein [Bacteroidaceae bacterium]|nr:DUF4835 family protein [Bacteroidaceae bacterium]